MSRALRRVRLECKAAKLVERVERHIGAAPSEFECEQVLTALRESRWTNVAKLTASYEALLSDLSAEQRLRLVVRAVADGQIPESVED